MKSEVVKWTYRIIGFCQNISILGTKTPLDDEHIKKTISILKNFSYVDSTSYSLIRKAIINGDSECIFISEDDETYWDNFLVGE